MDLILSYRVGVALFLLLRSMGAGELWFLSGGLRGEVESSLMLEVKPCILATDGVLVTTRKGSAQRSLALILGNIPVSYSPIGTISPFLFLLPHSSQRRLAKVRVPFFCGTERG